MSAITSPSVLPLASSLVFPPVVSRSAPGRRTVTDTTASLPKGRTEVALSPISDQHDDTARLFPCDVRSARDGSATRRPAEDALVTREAFRHRYRLVGADRAVHVGDALVPDRRSDGARHVLPALDAVERVVRLHGDDPHATRTQ